MSNKIIYSSKSLAKSSKPVKSKTCQQDLLVSFSNLWVVRRIKEDSNNQVQLVLLSLVCKERREEMMDELVEFIHQLSAENVEIAVGTLKKLIHFVKGGRGKQLTFPVIVIRLDNNSQTDTQVLVDSGCTGSCINQQFVINHKIPTKWMPLAILVYNVNSTLNKNGPIKEFATLQLVINDYYKYIDLVVTELEDIDLFLRYNWLKIHNPLIDWVNTILSFDHCSKTCRYLDSLELNKLN